MNFKIVQEHPRFILFFIPDETELNNSFYQAPPMCKLIDDIQSKLKKATKINFRFRGVEFGRLNVILENGIDVCPTTSTIYTSSDPCKSMEYGWIDNRMILLMYDSRFIKSTFKEISINTSAEEISKLQETYPTKEETPEGTIWLSRLAIHDKRRFTSYEVSYGGWIPNNPFEALVGVIFIGQFSDEELDKLEMKIKSSRLGVNMK